MALANNFRNTSAVQQYYEDYLGRTPSTSEIQWWLSNHNSTDEILNGIATSPEAQNRTKNANTSIDNTASQIANTSGMGASGIGVSGFSIPGAENTRDKLVNQILSQGNTSKWTGEGFGSAKANAEDMARILLSAGITDIKQFGRIDQYEPVEQTGLTLNGQPVQNPRPGLFYVMDAVDTGDGVDYVRRDLTPNEANQVKPTYGVFIGNDPEGGGPQYRSVDASTVTTRDGKTVAVTGQTFGNKVTGQELPRTYDSDRSAWGGTYAGKGNTGYRAEFGPDGTPYFYTTGGSSKDKLLTTLAPIVGLGLSFVPGMQGIGASLGAAIAPTVTATTQALIGNAIVQGALAEAQGGDFIKGAALSAAGSLLPGVSAPISEALGGSATADVVARGLTTGALSELTGGDFLDGALAGALAAGGGKLAGETLGLQGMTAATVGTSLVNGVVAKFQGRDVSDAMIAGAISGALSYKDTTEPIDATEREGSLAKVVDDTGDFTADYSLFGGVTFPKLEGIRTTPITDAGANVGESPVDYSLGNKTLANTNDGFGLNTSVSSNLDYMGGGQGLSSGSSASTNVDLIGGGLGLSSGTLTNNTAITDTVTDATEREGSLAKTTTTGGPSASDLLRTVAGLASAAGAGAVVSSLGSSSTIEMPRLQYGDIYKDAPIKGFAMRKDETTGRYTPFIGNTALLAKGGFVTRR